MPDIDIDIDLDMFFFYAAGCDGDGPTAAAAFDRAHQWWDLEMGMAYSKELDRYHFFHLDDEEPPNLDDYLHGTIAACDGFVTVADEPMSLAVAAGRAPQLLGTHPGLAGAARVAAAVPVCGEMLWHPVDIPIPADPAGGIEPWLERAAADLMRSRYPGESLQKVERVYRHHDRGIEQMLVCLHTLPARPDHHSGWAFFGQAPRR